MAETEIAIAPSDRLEILPRSGWTAPLITLIAAGMAFLGVLVVAATLAAGNLADAWRSDLAGVATVRVSGLEGDVAGRVKAVLEVLRTTPGIAGARPLSDDEQSALIAPWLGDDAGLAELAAPRLIDVVLDGDGPDPAALQARLDLTVVGSVYDDHAAWRRPLIAAAHALERTALLALLLVLTTTVAMIAFAARATLMANRDVIRTVRLLGAEDTFLLGSYVRVLSQRAAIGGAAGTLAAVAALLVLPEVEIGSEPGGVGLSAAVAPGWAGWLIMVPGVPLVGTVVTWITARLAVRTVLRQLP